MNLGSCLNYVTLISDFWPPPTPLRNAVSYTYNIQNNASVWLPPRGIALRNLGTIPVTFDWRSPNLPIQRTSTKKLSQYSINVTISKKDCTSLMLNCSSTGEAMVAIWMVQSSTSFGLWKKERSSTSSICHIVCDIFNESFSFWFSF